jgi:hypothetical protein
LPDAVTANVAVQGSPGTADSGGISGSHRHWDRDR